MGKVAQMRDELVDREAIRDCISRSCHAIDRRDFPMLRATYWDDATDDHGEFSGSADEFVAYAQAALEQIDKTQHLLGGMLISIQGDTAEVESYVVTYHLIRRGQERPVTSFVSSRYRDRMRMRDGEWRIAHRAVAQEWVLTA